MEEVGSNDVEDVTSTLQSFHIGENQGNIVRSNRENVFQMTHRRLQPQESAGVVSSEYSSDDSVSSNEKKSFKQRIQRKLNQTPHTSLEKDKKKNERVPDVVLRSDPCRTNPPLIGVRTNPNGRSMEIEGQPTDESKHERLIETSRTRPSDQSQNKNSLQAGELKPERRRRRFITREKDPENLPSEIIASGTDTLKAQSRRSLLNQGDSNTQTSETGTSTRLNQSPFTGVRAKSVERTIRGKTSASGEIDLSKSLNKPSVADSVTDNSQLPSQRLSSSRSAAECIRLRRVQSLERGQRPKISRNLAYNNKSCDDKQLSLLTTEATETPVIGSPLIAKLESTYKLLRSRSVRLASDTSSKSEESNNNVIQNANDGNTQNMRDKNLTVTGSDENFVSNQNNQRTSRNCDSSIVSQPDTNVETRDITLIFKSDETMNQPIDPNIHNPDNRASKLDPTLYPHISKDQNISNVATRNHSPVDVPSNGKEIESTQNISNLPKLMRTPASKSLVEASYEKQDTDTTPKFSRSLDLSDSALKRTPVVTDLDQAMKQRDEEKLRKLFKNTEGEINSENYPPKQDDHHKRIRNPSGADMETDLDNIVVPCTKVVTRPSPSTPKVYPETGKSRSSENAFIEADNLQETATQIRTSNNSKPCKTFSETKLVGSAVANLKVEGKRHDTQSNEDVSSQEYSPYMNLEDSVKWPTSVPGKLDFSHMEVFEGRMLLQWLTSSIDDNHYLRMMLTRHDLSVIGSQYCTCLIAAGVIKEVNRKDSQWLFKTDCMYYWAHTEVPKTKPNDIGKLTPSWPPPLQISEEDLQAGRKFTEADQQAMLVTVRNEYKTELEKVQTDHQTVLLKCREEYQNRLQNCVEKIAFLEREVARYKELAGIKTVSQTASSVATEQSGFCDENVQLSVAVTGTPYVNQILPAVTPECVQGRVPGVEVDNGYTGDMPVEKLKFSPENVGGKGTIPPPPPPPVPDIPPPPPPPGAPPPPPGPPGAPPLPGFTQLSRRDGELDGGILGILRRPLLLPAVPNVLWTFTTACSSLKPVINTKSPMKPLFWNRIVVNDIKSPKHKEYLNARLVWEEIDEARINFDDVDELFSKVPIENTRKSRLSKNKSPPKQFAKVIEPKRSQAIGILLSSLRLDFYVIEQAIMNLDTSQVEMEKLKAIYDNRADEDEMKKIKKHLDQNPGVPLDKPDQFLYDLTVIPDFAERMFCFLFQESFQESISVIENKLNNLKMTTDLLMNGKGVKDVLGLVLAVGNYMNGGNRSRGQADGFDISILPRLKDVKTKDNRSSLLQFVVSTYIMKFEYDNAGSDKAMLPLPDPSDISQAMLVNFDDINKELKKTRKEFDAAHKRSQKVIKHAHEDDLQPFKAVMEDFFDKGKHDLQEQEDSIKESKEMFEEIVIYFCVKPKVGDKVVTPEYFFSLWSSFCGDFKQMWKKEQQKVLKIKLQEAEKRLKQLQESKKAALLNTRTRTRGGLKDKLANKGML